MSDEWAEFFENMISLAKEEPTLEVLPTPCGDCAVVCNFYLEPALALRSQPKEIQEEVLRTWFCHNNRGRGCRGAFDVVQGDRE